MERIDFTAALAQLLSNAPLRQAFELDRLAAARKLAVCDEDVGAFMALDQHALQIQAGALLNKRRSEVAKILPATFKMLPDAELLFLDYAESHWPTGHRRHLEDAAFFCRYLLDMKIKPCQFEYNRVTFNLSGKRARIYPVRDIPTPRGFRWGLQILRRSGRGGSKEFSIYFDL